MIAAICLLMPPLVSVALRNRLISSSRSEKVYLAAQYIFYAVALNVIMLLILRAFFTNGDHLIYNLNHKATFACKYIALAMFFAIAEPLVERFYNPIYKKIISRFPWIQSEKWAKAFLCAASFLITVLIIFYLYGIKDYAPFGENSLATMDANIQYLDLFSYLKDVLAGENSISYTFSKTLGGTYIAVLSYYLMSPFNLLVCLFDKSNLVVCFDIVVALKLGTAALTAAYFLKERFQGKIHSAFVLLLSVSYALMQYSIAQSSNIMWLDGVYMLPLMLLGVYRLVNNKKSSLLIISTGLAIIFNWYSAGINCLFTAAWFVLEWLLVVPEKVENPNKLVNYTLKAGGKYILYMLIGVALSACIFLPTLASLAGGRGQIDWSIFKNTFNGNIINIIPNFTLGAKSANGSVSLYCGSLALLGCMGFFTSPNIHMSKKIKTGAVLAFSIAIFYWTPLFGIFSLLKSATSYWYRYSYVTIFLLIFIAGEYFSELLIDRNTIKATVRNGAVFSITLLLLSYISSTWELKRVYYTCLFMLVIALLSGVFIYMYHEHQRLYRIAGFSLAVICIFELGYNTYLLMDSYHAKNAEIYHDYSVAEQDQIHKLQEYDSGIYRITQTSTYNTSTSTLLTANYNEAAAYNYWSISGYTSDPDDIQRNFLNRLGYRINGENMCIVNTSILAADSLLGVKYVLSTYDINGLELIESLGEDNGKSVYLNPYALPMAFVYPEKETYHVELQESSLNPFEYQNLLYSQLLGEEVELYSPLEFEVSEEGKKRTYILDIPNGSYAVYGNIPWKSEMTATLDVNGQYKTNYSRWLSPSVFYIPTSDEDTVASVVLEYEKKDIKDEQFYILDLDLLSEVTERISQAQADYIFIENGHARFETYAEQGENLYVSIPYHSGWKVTLNGQVIMPDQFADCMISIPLVDGINLIEMDFSVPGLNIGIVITVAAIIVIAIMIFIRKRRQCYYH